jgi:hypothetical protein
MVGKQLLLSRFSARNKIRVGFFHRFPKCNSIQILAWIWIGKHLNNQANNRALNGLSYLTSGKTNKINYVVISVWANVYFRVPSTKFCCNFRTWNFSLDKCLELALKTMLRHVRHDQDFAFASAFWSMILRTKQIQSRATNSIHTKVFLITS